MIFLNRRYFPLTVYVFYVLFVFFALYIAPLKYRNIDIASVTLYVALATLIFSFGYIKGSRGVLKSPLEGIVSYGSLTRRKTSKILINTTLMLGMIIVVIDWVSLFQNGIGFNISKLGESYLKAYEGYERGQAKVDLAYILNILKHAIISVILMTGAYYYQGLKVYQKRLFFLVCGSYLILQVLGSGKQKYLGDCVIAFGVYLLFVKARFNKSMGPKAIAISIIAAVCVFSLFVEILNQRYIAAGLGLHNIDGKSHPLVYWDHDSFIFDIIGPEYGFALGIFLGYFTNGLYGLSLCLQLPFEWTYFVGNSYSVTRLVEIITNSHGDIQQLSYPVRAGLTFGWDASKWHSLYAWLASDFTFVGTLVISFFFGYVYGKLWVESINGTYFASGPLFSLFSLGLVFSLANNQLVHSLTGIASLFLIVALRIAGSLYIYRQQGR